MAQKYRNMLNISMKGYTVVYVVSVCSWFSKRKQFDYNVRS